MQITKDWYYGLIDIVDGIKNYMEDSNDIRLKAEIARLDGYIQAVDRFNQTDTQEEDEVTSDGLSHLENAILRSIK